MLPRTLLFVTLAAFAPLAWSQKLGVVRPDLDTACSTWRALHGAEWNFTVDPETGWTEMIYGGHTRTPDVAPREDGDFVVLAREAASELAGLHGLESSTLEFQDTVFLPLGQIGSSDKQTVRLRQVVRGVRVEGAYLNLLFSARGELLSVQSSGLPNAGALGTEPALGPAAAAGFAREHFRAATHVAPRAVGAPELLIAQRVESGQRTGILAWKVECGWSMPGAEPLRKLVYLEAATGALLRMDEGILNFDVRGTVSANASPGTLPDIATNPETAQLIKYGRCQSGATTVYTDASGKFNFPGLASSAPVSFTFVGTYAAVNYDPGFDYALTPTLPPNTDNSVLMNPMSTAEITAQANAYIVSTMMRDWIRGINPSDPHGDFTTVANVDVTGSCNAYYNGSSINFFPASGSCVNTAYATVISHEQGHWLNDRYATGNGGDGMGEGNADTWAMYLWDTPLLGANFSGGGSLRTGNNTRQFCGDTHPACYGEVHTDGEVWMGAAWKIRNNLNTSLGNTAGDLAANALFLGWMNAYNQSQIKSIIETQWMTLDDNDGDISNGAPHFTPIDSAFRAQGFPGLTITIPCAPPVNVCQSTLNSSGEMASMLSIGSNHISDNALVLIARGLPPNKLGLFIFSQTQTLVPFGNGWRCVATPYYRSPTSMGSPDGEQAWYPNLNALPGGAQIRAGETWYFQAWFRDPPAGGARFNTSDALAVPWCP